MGKIVFSLVLLVLVIGISYLVEHRRPYYSTDPAALARGKGPFATYCASCHGLDEEVIGPKLGGITSVLPESALTDFINDPEKVIRSGNARAVSEHDEFKLMMPSFAYLGADQVRSILAYIDNETRLRHIAALTVDPRTGVPAAKKRLVPPVKRSGLTLELEDFADIPRAPANPPDKGVATLRAYPSGNGDLFVSDQIGIIYRLSQGKIDTFLNIRSYIKDFIYEPGIGTGLGSFAFDPDFLHNGLFYTTHAEGYKGLPADNGFSDSLKIGLQWVLTEWKLTDTKAKTFQGSHRELLRLNTPTTAHGVQDIGFIPGLNKKDPGYGILYLGCGDGGSNNIKHPELSHTTSSFLGTILRIDPSGRNSPNGKYGIPPDNPFVDDKNSATRKEIWAYGFRNPHRFTWDLTYGVRMIAADIGESNIEEVNIIEKGGDYGWSKREGNYAIATKIDLKNVYPVAPDDTAHYKGPFGQYDHNDGNAISGGFVYHGPLRALDDKYIFGDIVQGKLFYLNIDKNLTDSTVYELNLEQNGQPTSLRQLNNTQRVHLRIGYDPFSGTLYIMTKNGKIRRVTKAFTKN